MRRDVAADMRRHLYATPRAIRRRQARALRHAIRVLRASPAHYIEEFGEARYVAVAEMLRVVSVILDRPPRRPPA